MDFRKNYCIYHPSELITNFCRESSHSVSQNNAYCLYTPVIENISDSVAAAKT
jgi:hypothetical protein